MRLSESAEGILPDGGMIFYGDDEMNKEEFKRFVYAFCKTERESSKNGGAMKIRCKEETRKMVEWFEANMG